MIMMNDTFLNRSNKKYTGRPDGAEWVAVIIHSSIRAPYRAGWVAIILQTGRPCVLKSLPKNVLTSDLI